MIYNRNEGEFNFANRRVSDIKGNARVILPKKAKNFNIEANLEMLRTECMYAFRQYTNEKCGNKGEQVSNLSREELKGMKSLKTRIKDAELVVVPTDKTGKFAVMSRETYEVSGGKHTRGDILAGWNKLEESQKEINGHVSMMVKCFNIGKSWSQVDRVRETVLGNGLTVCPVTLLYKDHKGWNVSKGGVPPTRHVAGGHVGMNLYLSEIHSK